MLWRRTEKDLWQHLWQFLWCWLLGGIFATTAKADDDVTLGYTFKEADLSKDKSSSSAEIKDGDGIVYEVTAVKGKGEEFSIAGNTLKLKGSYWRLWICQNICKKRLYKDKYRLLYRKYRWLCKLRKSQ